MTKTKPETQLLTNTNKCQISNSESQDKRHLGFQMAVHDDCQCSYCKGVRERMIAKARKELANELLERWDRSFYSVACFTLLEEIAGKFDDKVKKK